MLLGLSIRDGRYDDLWEQLRQHQEEGRFTAINFLAFVEYDGQDLVVGLQHEQLTLIDEVI